MSHTVKTLYALVTIGRDGREKLIKRKLIEGVEGIPLVATDATMIPVMVEIGQGVMRQTGRPCMVAEFIRNPNQKP